MKNFPRLLFFIGLFCVNLGFLFCDQSALGKGDEYQYTEDDHWSPLSMLTIGGVVSAIFKKPLQGVFHRFLQGYAYPYIDIMSSKALPSKLYEEGRRGFIPTKHRIKELILNDNIQVEVHTFLHALKSAAATNSPLPTLFVCGPPGSGKTELVKRLENEGPFRILAYTGTQLAAKSPSELRQLFSKVNTLAKDHKGRTIKHIIFIDEIEAFFKGSAFGERSGVLTEFLKANGTNSPHYSVAGTTNDMSGVDRAAFRRMSSVILVELPAVGKRTLIYKHYVKELLRVNPHYKKVLFEDHWIEDPAFLKTLDEAAEGLSGADLKFIAQNNCSESVIRKTFVITKDMTLRHIRKKKIEAQKIEQEIEAGEAKRNSQLQQRLLAKKLAMLEEEEDDEVEEEPSAKKITK